MGGVLATPVPIPTPDDPNAEHDRNANAILVIVGAFYKGPKPLTHPVSTFERRLTSRYRAHSTRAMSSDSAIL